MQIMGLRTCPHCPFFQQIRMRARLGSYPQVHAARWNGARGSALAPHSGKVRTRPTRCDCASGRAGVLGLGAGDQGQGLAPAVQLHQVKGLPVGLPEGLVVGLGAGAGCR